MWTRSPRSIGGSTHDAEAIVAETGGNPLLVTQMAADDVGGSLAVLLSRRDELLDDDARALLDLAATFGSEFDADLLATGQGAPLLAVLESLEQAEAAGIVVAVPGRLARFAFVHALFRSHRYQALSRRRRLELHAKAAAALASRPGDDRLLSERARHSCLAVPVADARTAVDLVREAAHLAEHAYAYDEAATHYRRGLEAARSLDPPDPRTSLDLTVRLAAALHHHGDPQGLPLLLDAARRARQEGDDAALVRVAISFSHFGSAGPGPAQLAIVEDALAVLDGAPSATRARLLIELAGQIGEDRVEESIELANEAEAIARQLGDLDLLGSVLLGARHLNRHPSRIAEYERTGVELEGLGHRLPSLALTLAGISVQTLTHLERGELGQWMERQQQFARLLGDRSLPQFQLIALANRASRAVLDGDFQRAEDLATSMGRLATSIGHSPAAAVGQILIITRRLQARDVELLDATQSIVHRGGEVSVYRCCLAAIQARAGRLDDALGNLATLRSDGYHVPTGLLVDAGDGRARRGGRSRRRRRDRRTRARRSRPVLRKHRCGRISDQPAARPGARPGRAGHRRRGAGRAVRPARGGRQPTTNNSGVPVSRTGLPRPGPPTRRCLGERRSSTGRGGNHDRRGHRCPSRAR